jgi:hypothetical protein
MQLEAYLADQYNRDQQDVQDIGETIARIGQTFAASFDPATKSWPYHLKAGSGAKARGVDSHGNSAMILAAVGKIVGLCAFRDGSYAGEFAEFNKGDIFDKGVEQLAKSIVKKKMVWSGTFGSNDPLTISHTADLFRSLLNNPLHKVLGSALQKARARVAVDELIARDPSSPRLLPQMNDRTWCEGSAFVALRIIRAKANLGQRSAIFASRYRLFFESRLHEQLSFSSIPDSRFDPAELTFALEGLLNCAQEAVEPALVQRVLSVLEAAQRTSAYWRPNRPFISYFTGPIALPLSIEGANSLLRSVEMIDRNKLHGTFAGAAVPMFRRFWQWLRARRVEIRIQQKLLLGWHSEHINDAKAIHLWDTSQVAEFLLAFRNLLIRHIARETLVLSTINVSEPKQNTWKSIKKSFEPLTDTSVAPRVYDRIQKDFLLPWTAAGHKRSYSMLLFGPPGTGKTTIARNLANALSFRLLTVTISDFLGAGGALA